MATVVTPHFDNQLASAYRSAVKAPNSRTATSSRPSGTATRWRSEPTSIPAALRFTCCNCFCSSLTGNSFDFSLYCDMPFSITENLIHMSQAQDAMLGNLPNGIVTTLASHYVTNVMNAEPETKLGYGQKTN